MYGQRKRKFYKRRGTSHRSRSYAHRKVYRRSRSNRKVYKVGGKWQKATTIAKYRKFDYAACGFGLQCTQAVPIDYHVFSGNAPFDPDETGVGVQPYGWDECFPSFFQRYKSHSSCISIYAASAETFTDAPHLRFVVVPYYQTVLPQLDFADVMRMPGARAGVWNANAAHPCKLKSYMSTKRLVGPTLARDDETQALYNTTPNMEWYWHVLMYTTGWTTPTIDAIFDVKIRYYVECSVATELNES